MYSVPLVNTTASASSEGQWLENYNIAAMTPAELVDPIAALADNTIAGRPMSAEYYQKRLVVIGMLAKIAEDKSGPIDAACILEISSRGGVR